MRHFLLAACIALLVAARGVAAQEANPKEMDAVSEIARCLVEGLPDDWVTAHMVVELRAPGASTGGVRYVVARRDAGEQLESFRPCDPDRPANVLIGLRATQPQERRGWIAARLSVERDGSFRLNYDFPK